MLEECKGRNQSLNPATPFILFKMSSTAGGEDKKEISEHINLKVTNNENGGEVYFKIKRTAPLEKLMKAYCDRIGTNVANMRFLFDGERLNPSQTPNDVRSSIVCWSYLWACVVGYAG